jgi:hypothetical protein
VPWNGIDADDGEVKALGKLSCVVAFATTDIRDS